MVKKKSKSSRQTLKQKYKIQKRVQEHDRKLRKLAKKGGKAPGKKFKDPGIPNSWPLKKELLEQVALAKEKAERKKVEDREARAEARKLAKAGGGSLAARYSNEASRRMFGLTCQLFHLGWHSYEWCVLVAASAAWAAQETAA